MAYASTSTPYYKNKYDAFLSYSGERSLDRFISSLYKRMRERGISPFIDDSRLQRGDEISPAALKAMEESLTSVVIFSKEYASSNCCLNELAQIMECRKKYNQTVIPVFNDISPSDVRNQTGPFADAFKNHEAHKSVQKWKDALNEAANIPGYDLQEFKSEAELAQVLVDDILKKRSEKLDKEAIHEPKPSSSNIIKHDSGHKDEEAPPDDSEEQDKGDEDKEPKHTSSNIGDQDRGDEGHDVYLSCRGEDTRHSFTSHLYDVLRENKISTFNDDGLLRRGDEISPALLEAIEGSRISLIIFSKGYAGSRLCLDELVKILECREKYNQIVTPVYYDIDPSDVKNQTGPFAAAFKNHEAHKSVQKWRDALTEASNLPGYNLSEFKSEAELTQHLIKIVLKKLGPVHVGDILERYTVSKNEDTFYDDMGNFLKRHYSGHKEEEIHDPKEFQWFTAERMFAATNLVLEVPSVVFDELSSVHKPQYALASMLMSFTTMLFCIIQLVYKGREGGVRLKRKGKILWLYYPNDKPFGTVTDFIGLICAIFQSIFTAVNYASYLRNIDDPIKISIWPLVFSFCLLCSTFSKESQNIDASIGSAVRRVNIV